jgi:hypothetical protein
LGNTKLAHEKVDNGVIAVKKVPQQANSNNSKT